MRSSLRYLCMGALATVSVGAPSLTHGQSAPPNLYQWLAVNSFHPGLQPTRNFKWYWGCAAGLPGACQYIAVGRTDPSDNYLNLLYNYGFMYTPAGVQYSFYDYWQGVSPDPNCQGGGGNSTMIPLSCSAVLSQTQWSVRVDTGFASGNWESFGATFNPVTGATVTPEPATLALLGSGLLGIGGLGRWRSRRKRQT